MFTRKNTPAYCVEIQMQNFLSNSVHVDKIGVGHSA